MLMPVSIETRWGKLLSLKVFHDFYKDEKYTDFKFLPTADTELLLKNFRILFRNQEEGLTLLYDKMQTHKLLKATVLRSNLERQLSFCIFNENRLLSQITEMEFEKDGEIFYFTNLIEDKNNKKGLINTTSIDAYKLPLKRKTFTVIFKNPVARKEVNIKNSRGDILLNKAVTDVDEKKPVNDIPIAIEYAPDGTYIIEGSKGEHQKVYCYGSGFNPKTWGIFDVFLNESKNQFPIFNDKQLLSPELTMQLVGRSTYWKYLLISRFIEVEDISEVKVTYEGKEFPFSEPKMVDLMTGGKAVMIESKNPIKATQLMFSNDRLGLKVKVNGKWSPKTVALPKPQVDMVKPDRENDKLYTVAYVYI